MIGEYLTYFQAWKSLPSKCLALMEELTSVKVGIILLNINPVMSLQYRSSNVNDSDFHYRFHFLLLTLKQVSNDIYL